MTPCTEGGWYARLTIGMIGIKLAVGCGYPGDTMGGKETDNTCQEAWSVIAARDFRAWKGLPEPCGYSAFEAAFARFRDEYGQGNLGKANRPGMFRMHIAVGYPHNLKVWFRDDRIVVIQIRYPKLPHPVRDLVHHLGAPRIKLDYYLDVMPVPSGAWIYPDKGLAVFFDAGHTEIMRIDLFHPCSTDEYLSDIHSDNRMREYPVRD